ncbi:S8 family serine peptidase [Rossellomorea vietnamensis]|uniref:S8 family serine peptidase n=1 Tax=Rossellomorea vietnamensis TaxID=218284 RepID=A0A5D4NTM0_9BACI|nr:S8 family serine peptidase [Rossellomorea vietnamensis]TYS17673.1 S8 family serine peptidase [Rossellomorea vietnamensis]
MKRTKKGIISAGLALLVTLSPVSEFSVSAEQSVNKISAHDLKEKIGKQLLREGKSEGTAQLQMVPSDEKLQENTLVVQYKNKLPASLHKSAGTSVKKRVSGLGFEIVSYSNKANLSKIIKTYQGNPDVISVHKSAAFEKLGKADPKVRKQPFLKELKAAEAQRLAGAHPVTVAVIDGGVDNKHPELKSNLLPSINMVDPLRGAEPDLHGTHVAGIIAGQKNNGIGGMGINPSAKILPVDVFNGSETAFDYVIAEGILRAIEEEADVINMSLGSNFPSPIIEKAVERAINAGITVVAAAGNSGSDEREYPAGFEGVISVGAVNDENILTSFSNYGSSVDVVAPGETIYSTGYDHGQKSTFKKLSGTSMAAPMVAGAASLILSKYPDLTPAQVEHLLESTSRDLGAKGFDLQYGYGLINPADALKADVKNLPDSISLFEDEFLANAKSLSFSSDKAQATGTIKLPGERHYYKLDVEEGEYIQSALSSSDHYDYGLDIYLYKSNKAYPLEAINVNDAKDGIAEGYLYKAPEEGTVVIGIRDVNGNYNADGKSSYRLNVEKRTELPEDESSLEQPVSLSLEKSLDTPLFLTGEEGDSDFFTFQVDKPQVVKFDVTGVPGIDLRANVFMTDPSNPEEELEGEDYLVTSVDNNGVGGKETLTIEVFPEMTYTVEVTNGPDYYFDEWLGEDLFSFTFSGFESLHPYSVSLQGKELPEDKDGFPDSLGEEEESSLDDETTPEQVREYYAKQYSERKENEDTIADDEDEFMDPLEQSALPLMEGEAGKDYIQTIDDIDLYHFSPETTGIYQWDLSQSETFLPLMELLAKDEEIGEWYPVATNYMGMYPEEFLHSGLVEGRQYILAVMNGYYQPSFEEYNVKVNLFYEGKADENEPNNSPWEATGIEEKAIGDYSTVSDMDYFYLPPGDKGIYGVNVAPVPEKTEAGVPAVLKAPIDPVLIFIEDSNGNQVIDYKESENMVVTDTGFDNEMEKGSFNRKQGAGYFILTLNYFSDVASLTPYELTVGEASHKDEDSPNTVSNNIPSQPLEMKVAGQDKYQAKGRMNYSETGEDVDWYKLPAWKGTSAEISLDAPADSDGALKVYSKAGKLIKEIDYYGESDNEVFSLDLTESGPYYIAVSDAAGNPSVEEYTLTAATSPVDKKVERIAGSSRYDTSLQFSDRIPDKSLNTVILASGKDYPDALAGAVLNKKLNGTILLVDDNTATIQKVMKETSRLLKKDGKVIILGGRNAIPASMETAIKKQFKAERVFGENRTQTAIAIAKKVHSKPAEIFLASGKEFADTLSVSPYAGSKSIPVLLNSSSGLDKDLEKFIKASGIKKVTVLGGEKALSKQVVSELKKAGVTEVSRKSGKDRYETSAKIAESYYSNGTKAAIASGKSFPDALVGSHLASVYQMPILLTDGKVLAKPVKDYMKKRENGNFYLYGGEKVLGKDIEAALK